MKKTSPRTPLTARKPVDSAFPQAQPPVTRTVLLAVTGESPAILTETVWALAHETPPVIPSRVVVITTSTGEKRIQDDLLAPKSHLGNRSVWQALRDELLAGHPAASGLLIMERQMKVITGPVGPDGIATTLDDLRSPADNKAAADFILEQVRAITANPDTRLIASIAGGRKTMGAMLYGAVTLLGRNLDRITHVLVNAPFDRQLDPPFFFKPKNSATHALKDRDGKTLSTHNSNTAHIELADIDFVPLSNRFTDLHEAPGSFAETVDRFRKALRRDVIHKVCLDTKNAAFVVDGISLKLDSGTANIPVQLCVLSTLLAIQPHLHTGTKIAQVSFVEIVKAHHDQKFKLSDNDQKAACQIAQQLKGKRALHAFPDPFDTRTVTNVFSWLRTTIREELKLQKDDSDWPVKGGYQLPPLQIQKPPAQRTSKRKG